MTNDLIQYGRKVKTQRALCRRQCGAVTNRGHEKYEMKRDNVIEQQQQSNESLTLLNVN